MLPDERHKTYWAACSCRKLIEKVSIIQTWSSRDLSPGLESRDPFLQVLVSVLVLNLGVWGAYSAPPDSLAGFKGAYF